jgi:hypothetical protein
MSLANSIIYGTEATVLSHLQSGADVNELDEYGFRPLIEAAIVNKTPIAELLIRHGALVDDVDSTGRTALHWAVENNNVDFCALLLSHGANPNHYTRASQPILINPILRNQSKLKNLLYQHHADLNFSLDYINAKLLGHRFELRGEVDIVEPKGKFIELDFEGFFLEFTIGIILHSLVRYRNNFGARHLRKYFNYVKYLIDAFTTASLLIKYQQYLTKIEDHQQQIDDLLSQPLLILPVAHHGHAITFIKFGETLWTKCDRGENSLSEGSVNIYRVNNRLNLTKKFLKDLIYVRQPKEFIKTGYKKILQTTVVRRFPMSSQITGNCSWSNVEAAIPVLIFLMMTQDKKFKSSPENIRAAMDESLLFYHEWCEWDKDRALHECIESFENCSAARKASKASILGAVLFQCCHENQPKDIIRAEKILKILTQKPYRYVLDSYIEIHYRRSKTLAGINLIRLLDTCGISWY